MLLEVKEKYKAKLKAQEELKGATSNNSSDNNINARVSLGKLVVVLDRP